ncbi:MAG: tetratricopeptide repeat protein [Rhodobiaceae bacterium]|nr:tetratricopeptide repeat protein [Rhodobiaceae bacterium]
MTNRSIASLRRVAGGLARPLLLVPVLAGVLLIAPAAVSAPQTTSLFGDYLAGRFAAGQRDNSAAAAFFREALRKDPGNEVILGRAFVLELATGNMDGAAELAQRLVKVDSGNRLARLTLGVRALRARQYAAARRNFTEADGSGPIAEMTRALLNAWSFQGAGKLDEALKELATLSSADWMAIYRTYNSALVAELAGNKKTAGEQYAEAYKLDPTVLRVAEAYARFAARNGNAPQAREIVDAYDKVSASHPYMTAIRSALDEGRAPGPIVDSTAAGAAESLYEIGALLAREGGEDHAIVYMQLALHLDPKAALPVLALADIHEQQRNYELAAQAYARVPETSPLYASAQIQRAHNLNALERFDEAEAILDSRVKNNPRDIDALRALGDLLRGRKHFEQGIKAYDRAIALLQPVEQQHWTLFYFRGICLERSKRWKEAEADFQKALELMPDQPFVLNYLGYSWVDQGINLAPAMAMIRKAVQLRPDDGYIVDSLGWAHYRLGNIADAVRELERAVELKPEDPVVNDHLGDAYWRSGRRLEARFQWSHARDLDPEPEDLEKIKAKLKDGLIEPEPQRVTENVAGGGERVTDTPADGSGETVAQKDGEAGGADNAGEAPKPAGGDETPPEAAKEPSAPEAPASNATDDAAAPSPAVPSSAPPPKAATPASTGGDPAAYQVRQGDTLWGLAQRYYGSGNAFLRIFEANQDILKDADRIFPGQSIRIPAAE